LKNLATLDSEFYGLTVAVYCPAAFARFSEKVNAGLIYT
jgi:hypothetical protein